MEYAIQTENLVKRYGNGVVALKGVSIKVKKGDVVGYVGPNGSGKTTTLKILTNLLTPTSGHAYINGVDVNKRPKEAIQHVGALIEVPGVYDYLTPHEMLTYFGKVHRMNDNAIKQRIKEVLELLKLTDWEHKKIGSFSTGMQRRLEIVTAILHNPEILILDEPILGLDPKGMRDIRELLKEFQNRGMTVFLSSHLLPEVTETCNRVIFLDEGKVIASDSIENIRNKTVYKVINIKLLNPPSAKEVDKIKSFEFADRIDVSDGVIHIHFDGKPETSCQILSKMVSSGFEIVSYTPESASLEDFYVSVMSEGRGINEII